MICILFNIKCFLLRAMHQKTIHCQRNHFSESLNKRVDCKWRHCCTPYAKDTMSNQWALMRCEWMNVNEQTIRMISPLPAAILRSRALFGKYGSRTPVIGFFSVYGAFAANSGLGLSSSSYKKQIVKKWATQSLLTFSPKDPYKNSMKYYAVSQNHHELTWKPIQSQWCASEADFRFQYSRKVTAENVIWN